MGFNELIEEAHNNIQHLKNQNFEIRIWRARYLDQEMKNDTPRAKAYFMAVPANYFNVKTIEEIAAECRKEASDG